MCSVLAALSEMVSVLRKEYGDLPVLFSGGVSSNKLLKKELSENYGAIFAEPAFSADNAAGIAVLTALMQKEVHFMNYNAPLIITVGQLNRYVKSLLDADENLYNLYLVGEISNFTDHYKSGHFYFSLKDEDAQIKAVMFRNNASRVRFRVENGMRVIVRGRVSMYEAAGQYQIFVDDMQPDGVGALNLAFEQLKKNCKKRVCLMPRTKNRFRKCRSASG